MQPWLRFAASCAALQVGARCLSLTHLSPKAHCSLVTPLSRDMLLAPAPLLRSSRAEPCVRRAREWPLSGARAHSPHGGERHYSIVEQQQGRVCGCAFLDHRRRETRGLSNVCILFKVSLKLYRETRARCPRTHTYIRDTRARALARLCARALCAELCAPTTKLAPRHLAGESHTHTWISHCEVIRSKPIAFVHVGGEQAPGPGSAWLGSGSGCQG